MAKKKENKRRDYTFGSKDVITYEKSNVQRKMYFLVLRGPGLKQQEIVEENPKINEFALRQRIKVKLVQTQTEEEVIEQLKDSNSWAGGVVFNPGTLTDDDQEIKKAIKKILIPVHKIATDTPTTLDSYLEGLKILIKKQPPK